MRNKEAVGMSARASAFNPLAPIMPLWQATEFLRDYFSQEPPYAPGDDLGTCYSSYAAVMLSAMVIGTESPVVLAGVTSYPAPFIAAVFNSMHDHCLWHHRDVLGLRVFLETTPKDWKGYPWC